MAKRMDDKERITAAMERELAAKAKYVVEGGFAEGGIIKTNTPRPNPGELPDSNPKTAQGMKKLPIQYVPTKALLYLALVMEGGAIKYGPYNFRDDKITASVYFDAMMRHLLQWWNGETYDDESGQPHLAHVMACCAILIDGFEGDFINDNRPIDQVFIDLFRELNEERSK